MNVRKRGGSLDRKHWNEYDAVIIIRCRREHVLDIIEYVKERFPYVSVTYEVSYEE